MMKLVPLHEEEETPELPLLTHMKRSRGPPVRRWPPTNQEKWPQDETYLASILISDFSASRTMRNKFLLKPPSLWDFVMAVQADRTHD